MWKEGQLTSSLTATPKPGGGGLCDNENRKILSQHFQLALLRGHFLTISEP